MKKRTALIAGGVLFLLVAARIALPSVLLNTLNEKLGNLDGPFCAHLEDLNLSLWRGTYFVQDLYVARFAPGRGACDEDVLKVRSLKVSLSWSQLLRGRARLDVEAHQPEVFADGLINTAKVHKPGDTERDATSEAKAAADILVPWRIDSLALNEGRIHLKLLGTKESAVTFDHAEGLISGIEQDMQGSTPTLFRLKGNIFEAARLLLTGSVNLAHDPALWEVDYGVERVRLTEANPLLLNRLPITFTAGLMDVYGEAAGGGKKLDGYAKLLFRDIDVVADSEKFKSFRHGIIEVLGSLFFLVAKNPNRQTAGTIVNFGREKGELKVDVAGTVSSSLAHRNGSRPVTPGIENRLSLPDSDVKPNARAAAGPDRNL